MKLFLASLLMLASFLSIANEAEEKIKIATVLDSFHQAAANAQIKKYFNLLTDDAVFIGTDAKERWTKIEFKAFVKPYFSQGKGWLYQPKKRNISIVENLKSDNEVAFFDEILFSKSYGTCRGTGVLFKTKSGWKIAQYSLSIPLPNEIATDIVKQIQNITKK